MNDGTDNIAPDDILVARVQSGDLGAFEALIDRHLVHLRTFIALKAPVATLVDELAHESLVFAFHNLKDYRPGTSFRAWLRSIAANLLRAEIQRYRREQLNQERLTVHLAAQLDAAASQSNSAGAEYLEECVDALPPPMRHLLLLKYQEGRSTEEISRQLQRSLAWVRTVLFRLRQQLKECIDQKAARESAC